MSSVDESADETPVEPDCYLEGEYLVFTASYHRKRGYCCNSGCRHCPYREEQPEALPQAD